MNGHGHLDGPEVPDQVIASALAGEIPGLREGAYALLEKERIALRPLDEQALEGMQAGVVSEEGAQHGLRAGSREGIDPQLRVVRPVSPGVLVLGPIASQKEHPGRGQTLHETVEKSLALGIHPVKIVEHEKERLRPALPQQEPLDGVEDEPAALRWIQDPPLRVLAQRVEEGQERGHRGLEPSVESEELARHPFADRPRIVSSLDPEVDLQEVDDRQIGRGPPVRHRAGFQREPVARARDTRELVE